MTIKSHGLNRLAKEAQARKKFLGYRSVLGKRGSTNSQKVRLNKGGGRKTF